MRLRHAQWQCNILPGSRRRGKRSVGFLKCNRAPLKYIKATGNCTRYWRSGGLRAKVQLRSILMTQIETQKVSPSMTIGKFSTRNNRRNRRLSGIEQERFAQRLKIALNDSHFPNDSPTLLAREFNARFPNQAVTVHAARKWLVGEAIPTQAKLVALAEWLNVSAGWLRFADDDAGITVNGDVQLEPSVLSLITDLQRLDKNHLGIAREFIRMLLRMS